MKAKAFYKLPYSERLKIYYQPAAIFYCKECEQHTVHRKLTSRGKPTRVMTTRNESSQLWRCTECDNVLKLRCKNPKGPQAKRAVETLSKLKSEHQKQGNTALTTVTEHGNLMVDAKQK